MDLLNRRREANASPVHEVVEQVEQEEEEDQWGQALDQAMNYELRVMAGNSNRPLAEAIARNLGRPLMEADVRRFSDGEIYVSIKENVRGKDVFVVQATSPPVNDNLVELLLMIDTLKRASAKRITAVIPYFGYARQDRKCAPRVPISARLVADLIEAAGAHRVLAFELHAGQIQGFFRIPVDHMYAIPVFRAECGTRDAHHRGGVRARLHYCGRHGGHGGHVDGGGRGAESERGATGIGGDCAPGAERTGDRAGATVVYRSADRDRLDTGVGGAAGGQRQQDRSAAGGRAV
eukprot:ctg_552.g249